MLIKEYRIALPLSVDEYRIAQLYMIQKKSREETQGEGSGVEIIENKPYKDGPGGEGQYTYKIYHIGSHLPNWFRAILPKSALRVEEEAWNAYPYTKTRYRCPFIEKFVLEIETKYLNDGGEQENIFNIPPQEMKNRQIDFLDIVKDPISSGDYKKEEDPKIYKSSKTGRGPLMENWRVEYARDAKIPGKKRSIMTAYKLCKVEFKYWGMQNKIERFIHDIGLRKTMLRAHRQAWCWQDEWYGLKLSDIRRLERETQLALAQKMADVEGSESKNHIVDAHQVENENTEVEKPRIPISSSSDQVAASSGKLWKDTTNNTFEDAASKPPGYTHTRSFSNSSRSRSNVCLGSSRDISASRMFESIERLQESSSDEDEEEFFDAKDEQEFWSDNGSDGTTSDSEEERPHLARTSSVEMAASGEEFADAVSTMSDEYTDTPLERKLEQFRKHYSIDQAAVNEKESSPPCSAGCKSSILFMILHGGNILDHNPEHLQTGKRSDFSTVKAKFDQVIQAQYPGAVGHIAFRLVPCPQICADSLSFLSGLSPFGFDTPTSKCPDAPVWTQEFIPLGAISLFATSNPDYHEYVNKMVAKANLVYQEFLLSDEGKGFTGQVCFLADATGSLLAYDALSLSASQYNRGLSSYDSHTSLNENEPLMRSDTSAINIPKTHLESSRQLSRSDPDLSKSDESEILSETVYEKQFSKSDIVSSEFKLRRQCSNRHSTYLNVTEHGAESCRRTSTGSYFDGNYLKFDFDVTDFFMLGAPLGLVLAYRRMFSGEDKYNAPPPPACSQVYNLFHSSDPVAVRLEPLIHNSFRHIAPVKLPRFNKFPLGDGEPIHVVETVQSNLPLFTGNRRHSGLQRQSSITSVGSQMSGLGENAVSSITGVTSRWWGNKRLDYVLYCPEVLHSFPVTALPHLFHASFWESCDAMAFILRQVLRSEMSTCDTGYMIGDKPGLNRDGTGKRREKWLKRRTTIKVKNLQPNHRGNDVIVLEDKPQVLMARFMYGPFDVTSLSGERVDIHIMEQSTAEWKYMATNITDKHGRLTYTIPEDKALPDGMHQVKIVVRGDHSSADFYLTVLPPKTEIVVFSIDGSFTASMSITGKDPKVRGGAVDVVRHWQDQGYLILYVTARPDMQHRKVVSWLAMHNFPHGMVSFMDGLSKEPLKQKLHFLKSLKTEAQVTFRAGYGSSKDIYVYKELGLSSQQIFIIGKTSKKYLSQAQVLSDGYAAHLNTLQGITRPAGGNARLFIQKGHFCLPVQGEGKKPVKRSASNHSTSGDFLNKSDGFLKTTVSVGPDGNTIVQQGNVGGSRARGSSPRPHIGLKEAPR